MSKANPSMQIAHTVRLYAVHRSAARCGPAALSNDRRAIESLPSGVLSPQGAAQAGSTRAASVPSTASSCEGVYALHSSEATRCIDPQSITTDGLSAKLLAHEDALVAGLGPASRFFVTDRRVEALILHHLLMRVEPNFAIPAP